MQPMLSVTLRQRSRADRRDQWWKRTQWALDKVLSADDPTTAVGLSVLDHLAGSPLADEDDLRLLLATGVLTLDVPTGGAEHD